MTTEIFRVTFFVKKTKITYIKYTEFAEFKTEVLFSPKAGFWPSGEKKASNLSALCWRSQGVQPFLSILSPSRGVSWMSRDSLGGKGTVGHAQAVFPVVRGGRGPSGWVCSQPWFSVNCTDYCKIKPGVLHTRKSMGFFKNIQCWILM